MRIEFLFFIGSGRAYKELVLGIGSRATIKSITIIFIRIGAV